MQASYYRTNGDVDFAADPEVWSRTAQDNFADALAELTGLGNSPLIGSDGRAIFQTTIETLPSNSIRAISQGGLPDNDRSTGVRSGSFFARDTASGHIADFRQMTLDRKIRMSLTDLLSKNPECKFMVKDKKGRMVQLGSGQTVDCLRASSCVIFGFWVRFCENKLADKVRTIIGYDKFSAGGRKPQRLRAVLAKNTLFFSLVAAAAISRDMSEYEYRTNHLGDPIPDRVIYAMCQMLQVNAIIIQMNDLCNFSELLEQTDATGVRESDPKDDSPVTSGVITKAERKSLSDMKPIVPIMDFIGWTGDTAELNKERMADYTVIFVCSCLQEEVAHIDVLLDRKVQLSLMGKRGGHRFRHRIRYENDEEDGYFDRVKTVVERNTLLTPKPLYGNLEAWDLDEVIQTIGDKRINIIQNKRQYDSFMAEFIDQVKVILDVRGPIGEDMYNTCVSLLGNILMVERSVIDDIATKDLRMDIPHGIVGNIFILSDVHRRFKEAGLAGQISFSDFRASMGVQRARKMYTDQVEKVLQSETDECPMEVITKFDDVHSFNVNSTRLLKILKYDIASHKEHELTMSMRFLTVRSYEDERYKIGRAMLEAMCGRAGQISKRAWRIVDEQVPQPTADQQSQAKAIRKQRAELFDEEMSKVNEQGLSFAFASRSALPLILGKDSKVFRYINETFATYASLRAEMIYVADPQIDEPVVPNHRLSSDHEDFPNFDESYYEVDLNMCYTQVLMGRFDTAFKKDFWGQPWIHMGMNRPTLYPVRYDDGDFIQSYQGDMGFVFLSGIKYKMLQDLFPEHFTTLCSWFQFSECRFPVLERWVPCASIIHLCSLVVSHLFESLPLPQRVANPPDRREKWIHIQRDILGITHVHRMLSEDERGAVIRAGQFLDQKTTQGVLNGIVRSVVEERKKHRSFIAEYDDAIEKEFKLVEEATGCRQKAKAYVKFDCNQMVGSLKFGRTPGGVALQRASDILRPCKRKDEDGDEQVVHKFQGMVIPNESLAQFHVCDVPVAEFALAEIVHVKPVVLRGFPRTLRISILERARLVIDDMARLGKAFRVKTDAVFVKPNNLDAVVEYLNKTEKGFRANYNIGRRLRKPVHKYPPAGPEWVKAIDKCTVDCYADQIEDGTCDGVIKLCEFHSPSDLGHSPLAMMTYKVEKVMGMERPVADLENEMESAIQSVRMKHGMGTGTVDDFPKRRPVTDESKRIAAEIRDKPIVTEEVRMSDFFPSCEEMIQNDMTEALPRQLDEDAYFEQSKLKIHCQLRLAKENNGVMVIRKGSAVRLDRSKIYKWYRLQFERRLEKWSDGCLLEGPPGTGKSYAVCDYIRSKQHDETEMFFVATATHMTLEPYMCLDQLESGRVHVSTVHSFVGVFNQIPEVAANPREWFGKDETRYRSRFMREYNRIGVTKRDRNAPPNPAQKVTKVTVFIDEYEIMQVEFEQILLYIYETYANVNFVLLGDRKQTAAYGRGVRCDGEVVKTVTRNRIIHFDLPFRNPSVEFFRVQQEASCGRPTDFLGHILCDYSDHYSSKSARSTQAYKTLTKEVFDSYVDAGSEWDPYNDRVVSLQNYKAFTVFAMDVMEHMTPELMNRDHRMLWHTGPDPCGRKNGIKNTLTAQIGSVDEVEETKGESVNERMWGVDDYISKTRHGRMPKQNPSSKKFLVGTKMFMRLGFSYRSIYAFTPRIEMEKPKGIKVRMGKILVLERIRRETYTKIDGSGEVRIRWYEFKMDGDDIRLREEEVQMYLYYPFCLYSDGVVGQTYKKYTLVNFFQHPTNYSLGYPNIRSTVNTIQMALGASSWVTPLAKTLNVATTRVLYGSKVRIMEIQEKAGAAFWHDTILKSQWHLSKDGVMSPAEKEIRIEMRRAILRGKMPLDDIITGQDNEAKRRKT